MLSAVNVRLEQRGAVQFCARLGRSPSETHHLLKSAYQQDALRKAATRTYHKRYQTMGTDVYNVSPKVKKTRTRRLRKSDQVHKDNTDLVNYIISQQAHREHGSDGRSEIDSLGNSDTYTDESIGNSDNFTDVGDFENESIGNNDNFPDAGDVESENMSNSDDYIDLPDVTPDDEDDSVDSFHHDSSLNCSGKDILITNAESAEKNKRVRKLQSNFPFKNKNPIMMSSDNKKKSKNNAHGFYLKLNGE
ncbi:unnamed protein product, partial [Meganyctiphanes norvegica]